MRAIVLAVLASCAVAPSIPADHPASPQAPIGALAGAPAALRPGVVVYPDLPKLREPGTHEHHHHAP